MEYLLKMLDLPTEETTDILNTADQLKYEKRHNISHPHLAGKTLGVIFQKVSTRTRMSFETGVYQLGGYPLFPSSSDLQIGRGEPMQDTARVLSWCFDGITIRIYEQSEVEALAEYGLIPVVNDLTDLVYPCQVLTDPTAIREAHGQLGGLKVRFIGGGNNMFNSLTVGGLKTGVKVSATCPKGYEPDTRVPKSVKGNPNLFLTDKSEEAIAGVDTVITDIQSSMGMEVEKKKRQYDFTGYQINSENLRLAAPEAMVLYCLPAHRGEEIAEGVFEAHADEIFEEVENHLYTQKAVLIKLLG